MAASFDVDNFNASTNRVSLPAVLVFCKGSSQSNAARDTKNFLVERGWRVVKEVFKRNRVQVIVGTAKDALMMARALDVSVEKEQSLVACFGDLGNKEDSILLPGPSHEEMPEDTLMNEGDNIASLHEATNSLPELAGGSFMNEQVAMESGEPSLELALPTRDQVKAFMVHPDEFCIKFDNLVSEWFDYRFDNGERFVESVLGKPGDEFKNHHIVRDGYHCFTVEGFKRLCLQCPKPRGQQVRTYFIECELEVAKALKEPAPVAMDAETTLKIEEERTEQARINLEIAKEKKEIVIIKEQRETGRVYKQEETKQKGQDVMATCTKMKSDASVSIQVEKTRQESEKTKQEIEKSKQAELGLRSIELQLQLKRAGAGGSSAAGSRTRPRTAEDEEERARLQREREQKAKEEEEARAERIRQREIEKKKKEDEAQAARDRAMSDRQAVKDSAKAKKDERDAALNDALEKFLADACTFHPDGHTSTTAFKAAFEAFVENRNIEISPKASGRELVGLVKAKGVTKKTARVDKRAVQAYVGISLNARF